MATRRSVLPFVRAVELLLGNGATVELICGYRRAIQLAAKLGNRDVMELLLDRGADIDTRDKALHLASMDGNEEVMQLLLDRGANIESNDNKGRTPLYWAILNGESDCCWTTEPTLKSNGGNLWPLKSAISRGDRAVVELLLDRGVDIHATSAVQRGG